MKRRFILLTALVLSTLCIWMFLNRDQESNEASQGAALSTTAPGARTSASATTAADSKANDTTKSEDKSAGIDTPKPLLSYREEQKNIASLIAQLPKSRPTLLAMIEKEDVFKRPNREIKEHSIDEITQNQMGATKVMALRALMKADKDPNQLKQDIDHIIQTAKDPTIVKIAKAARDSVDKGQHFPDDLLEGIDQMPLKK